MYLPVCTDESLASDQWVRRDLHGRPCAAPSCMGAAEASAACHPTEADLPGPFYQPGVRRSPTVGRATVCPASAYPPADHTAGLSDDDEYTTSYYRTLNNPYNNLK